MKNYDLDCLGIQELNAVDLKVLNGGWKMFGRNDLDPSDGDDCGTYTINLFWIPIAVGYRLC
jgi:hypothetical protein